MSSKTWPRLYKKASTGAIQFWDIEVSERQGEMTEEQYAPMYGVMTTRYGQLDTPSPQVTNDTISEGKNVGKKNETSPYEQACLEAKAKWQKQKKKGYVETLDSANAGEVDELIEGGIEPMLAHSFSKQGHKIKYPCYGQPKLDGIRCIAILKDGKCTLWSRTRKPITGIPHIAREIEKRFKGIDIVLDGEAYAHVLKKDFEKIVSYVRQEEPQPGHEIVQYHVYDVISPLSHGFEQRWENYLLRLPAVKAILGLSLEQDCPIHIVHTVPVETEEAAQEQFVIFTAAGYEGLMLRNADGKYVNKRSYDLQKVKEFESDEFNIIGVEQGRGKLSGHVGAFVCQTEDGKTFLAKMSGDTVMLRKYLLDPTLWQGKKLTVKYQGLTGANAVPRFPVGVVIRDYE